MPHHNPQGDRNYSKMGSDGVHKNILCILSDYKWHRSPAESEFDDHFSCRAQTFTM